MNNVKEQRIIDDLANQVRAIAILLPTGITDPQAMVKLNNEREELREEISRYQDGAATLGMVLTEVADCAYYAVKTFINGGVDKPALIRILKSIIDEANICVGGTTMPTPIEIADLSEFINAKYIYRIVHGKTDEGKYKEAQECFAAYQDNTKRSSMNNER